MDSSDVVTILASYTAELQPFDASNTEQLRELRAAIARNADSIFAPDSMSNAQISLTPALQTELESLAASGAFALAAPARIFRKTIPSRTEFNPAATLLIATTTALQPLTYGVERAAPSLLRGPRERRFMLCRNRLEQPIGYVFAPVVCIARL